LQVITFPPMWLYSQSSGALSHDGKHIGTGYSGRDEHKNRPESQTLQGLGPIPRGSYEIQPPRDTDSHGPYVMPLRSDIGNVMFGRSGFLIHGDSKAAPGTASHGCIILPRAIRETVWQSGDRQLSVVA
jgi:hypothetical protein